MDKRKHGLPDYVFTEPKRLLQKKKKKTREMKCVFVMEMGTRE